MTVRVQVRAASLRRIIRAAEWWDFKLVPVCSIFYATAYTQDVPVTAIWPAALALLLALAPCAAYVSLVNDVTDRADDGRAGKANRMTGRPAWQVAILLGAPLSVAVVFTVLWRDDLPLVLAYWSAWTAFTLYSVPPARLKCRGTLGLVADASGAHLFPTMVAALLAYRAGGKPVDWIWMGTVAAWAFGCGLRGILWHQLHDREADRKAAVATFVQRHLSRAAMRLAAYVALPIEIAGLAALIWRLHSPWPLLLLLVYAGFVTVKSRVWNVAIVLAAPRERYAILGTEYYTLLFAVGILLGCALRNPADWAALIVHLLVFPRPPVALLNEARLLLRDLARSNVVAAVGALRRVVAQQSQEVRDGVAQAVGALHAGNEPPAGDPAVAQAQSVPWTRVPIGARARPMNHEGTTRIYDDVARAARLDDSIAKAAAFLRQCLRSGAYGLACIGNDGTPRFSDNKGHVFVASFIAEALTGLLDEIDRTIILVRILSEESDGVWGFSPPGPYHSDQTRVFHVDSDDTAYVIRTLRRLGVNRTPQCLLRFYRDSERLFATFDAPGPTLMTTERSPRNNLLAHPEVNANVFLALKGTHLGQHVNYDMLRRAQDERGFWASYFYPSPLFATLLALDMLHGNPEFAAAIHRALSYIVGSQNCDGSWGAESDPYETALAVAALAGHQAHAEVLRRGVEYLLSTMAGDGSWTSRACVWEFHAAADDVWRAYDLHRAFVSSRCATALRRAAGHLVPLP